MLDDKLLEVLACPLDKTKVTFQGEWLVCPACGRRYPIRDGIPIMLVEEAELPKKGGASDRSEGT